MQSLTKIIQHKKSGKNLSSAEIRLIVNGYIGGAISDDEMTEWLCAVVNKGMSHEETLAYTETMLNSGARLDFSHLPGFVLDKHSTGGVGDKVSLILAPLLAACGCYVPMLAGRGLEHTGGTIDKLEAIPGYRTSLSLTEFQNQVEGVGISIMEQSEDICPADQKIYALRDVTGTVASLPLICGSIMSKKIAEGIKGLVLDVKVGNGAFMKSLNQANELGILLKKVGELYGLKVSACFTDMNQPLGNSAGLWCEVKESIQCLQGNGSADLMAVVYYLGAEALKLAAVENPKEKLKSALADGSAFEKFKQWIKAQGGDLQTLDNPETHRPLHSQNVQADSDGFIVAMNTQDLGNALVGMGAGRKKKADQLDNSAGILFIRKTGEEIKKGELIAEVFCSNKQKLNIGSETVRNAIKIESEPPADLMLIYQI